MQDPRIELRFKDAKTGETFTHEFRMSKAKWVIESMSTLEHSLPLTRWEKLARVGRRLLRGLKGAGRGFLFEVDLAWWMLPQHEKDKVLPPSNDEIQERRERLREQNPGLYEWYERNDWQPIA